MYHHQSRRNQTTTPVPRPGANRAPYSVTVCTTGTCRDCHRQHAAGSLPKDKEKAQCSHDHTTVDGKHRRHSCHGSRPRSHAAETMTIFVESRVCLSTEQGTQGTRLYPHLPCLSTLNYSIFFANIYRGLHGDKFFLQKLNLYPLWGGKRKSHVRHYSEIFCQGGAGSFPVTASSSSEVLSSEHSPTALL